MSLPVLPVGGAGDIRDLLQKTTQPLANDVQGAVIAGCGHFLPGRMPGRVRALHQRLLVIAPLSARAAPS